MKKKRVHPRVKTYIRLGLIGLGALVLVGGVILASQTHDIVLTGEQIQQRIDAKLPLTKKGITVTQAQVKLTDTLDVSLAAHGRKLGQSFDTELQATAGLHYNSGEFYLFPLRLHVERFAVNGQSTGQIAKKAVDAVTGSRTINEEIDELNKKKGVRGAVGRWLTKRRDHLADNKAETVASFQKKTEAWVTAGAGYTLQRVPVYRLPDNLKGAIIGMMIKDIRIADGKLIAHLSFWQLGLSVLMTLVMFAFLICLAIYCPQVFGLFLVFAEVAEAFAP